VNFTAAVTNSVAIPIVTAATTPEGSVSFYDGTASIGSSTLASGVATYSTNALSVGQHNITAVYTGTQGFSASTSNVVAEVISAADFSLSASPASLSVYTGEAASYTVTIAPGAGFDLPVALTCAQAPVTITCSFSPSTVTGGNWSSTLVVQTHAPKSGTTTSALSARLGFTALAGILLFFIPRGPRRRRHIWPMFLLFLAALAAATAITACGGPGSLSGGTQAGAQTITVAATATNGSQTLTHATAVTLNVKSLF
jgi:hypothetical protein